MIDTTIEVNTNAECAPLAGYAIYAWHCTRDGFDSQIATVSGNVTDGYVAKLTVGIAI